MPSAARACQANTKTRLGTASRALLGPTPTPQVPPSAHPAPRATSASRDLQSASPARQTWRPRVVMVSGAGDAACLFTYCGRGIGIKLAIASCCMGALQYAHTMTRMLVHSVQIVTLVLVADVPAVGDGGACGYAKGTCIPGLCCSDSAGICSSSSEACNACVPDFSGRSCTAPGGQQL